MLQSSFVFFLFLYGEGLSSNSNLQKKKKDDNGNIFKCTEENSSSEGSTVKNYNFENNLLNL